jgi:hypothetical protein
MDKIYGLCFDTGYISPSSFCFFKCKNKTETRKAGNLYRKQWNVEPKIYAIVEIPAHLVEDDFEKAREFASETVRNSPKYKLEYGF